MTKITTVKNTCQKKIAVIQDISGFGRCSMTVALPIISALRIQACPVPTSILSNHTAYPNYFFDDYTDKMPEYIDNWKQLGLSFDGIYTGFLGSVKQIAICLDFIRDFKTNDCQVIIDPVMGDDGRAYTTYTPDMCMEMKKLAEYADILTPNLTEVCILTDTDYHKGVWKESELRRMSEKLMERGAKKVVITGIPQGGFIANYVFEQESHRFLRTHRIGSSRCGTGDVFASIIAAMAVRGSDFSEAVRLASRFVKACIAQSDEWEIPLTDGVCFEEKLHLLTKL